MTNCETEIISCGSLTAYLAAAESPVRPFRSVSDHSTAEFVCRLSAMYGRRWCGAREKSSISAKRSGAAMYSAFECSRCGCWP